MKKPLTKYKKLSGNKLEHRLIAERILGRPLKGEEQVHHVDFNGENNAHENLVICPNMAYHKLLHLRERALSACGNVNWRKCKRCGKWDDPAAMRKYKKEFVHQGCANEHCREYIERHRSKIYERIYARYQANKTEINERRRQRYATDPVYREKVLSEQKKSIQKPERVARRRAYAQLAKSKENARRREKYATDAAYREKKIVAERERRRQKQAEANALG